MPQISIFYLFKKLNFYCGNYIQERQLFKRGNYSRAETIWRNTGYKKKDVRSIWEFFLCTAQKLAIWRYYFLRLLFHSHTALRQFINCKFFCIAFLPFGLFSSWSFSLHLEIHKLNSSLVPRNFYTSTGSRNFLELEMKQAKGRQKSLIQIIEQL